MEEEVYSPDGHSSASVWRQFGFKKDRGGWLHKGDCAFCKLCRQKVAHGGGTTHVVLLIAIIKFQYC